MLDQGKLVYVGSRYVMQSLERKGGHTAIWAAPVDQHNARYSTAHRDSCWTDRHLGCSSIQHNAQQSTAKRVCTGTATA